MHESIAATRRAARGNAIIVAIALALLSVFARVARSEEEPLWSTPVKGWKQPEPGEHPRLFFRKHELPEMKRRAGTPEGKRIVERLRFLLNGSDGESLPGQYNQSRRSTDDPGEFGLAAPAGNVSTATIGNHTSDRLGLKHGGHFAQGFGAVAEKYKPALLWTYNNVVEPDPRERTYDTVSVYPHRAILSLVNWPIGMAPKNPAELLPKAHRDRPCFFAYRNRWKDESDVLVTIQVGKRHPFYVCGYGMKLEFGCVPGPTLSYYREAEDGSMILSNAKGRTYMAVDFSRASGAEALIAVVGRGAWCDEDAKGYKGATARFATVNCNGYAIVLLTLQEGEAPSPRVEGDRICIGGQTVSFDGERIHLGKMASGPPAETRPHDRPYTPEEDRALAEDKSMWPAKVKGWKEPQAGEHPRLFFRRRDLAEVRRRAGTEDGKRIVRRLRFLLNGGDGESLPKGVNPAREPTNFPGPTGHKPHGSLFSLWHAAGYGMLFQLTGEKKYADLGRRCVEMMLKGVRDRDNRYSFVRPHGALRAGPSLGAMAMGYDLCYDGWDDGFRRRVALEIQNYDQGPCMSFPELARGSRYGPEKNHWGPQVGGGGLAALAIRNDPGVDKEIVEQAMGRNQGCMIAHLTRGFGDGGFYTETQGPGGIASDTAFVPCLQAWKVAGGLDFITPRRNASYVTVLKVHELIWNNGRPWYTIRGAPSTYGTGNFLPYSIAGMQSDRIGLSRAGQFAQGFGAVREKYKPALLWSYNNIVERDPEKRTYDTVSYYPHRAVLSLVNWPIGMEPKNPGEILPKVHIDRIRGYFVIRNQWKDKTDVVITMKAGHKQPIAVWGSGMKVTFGALPGMTFTYFKRTEDGSVIISNPKGKTYLAIDFSRASGAEAVIVLLSADGCRAPDAKGRNGATVKFHSLEAGGYTLGLLTLQTGTPPVPKVDGDAIVLGEQTYRFDGRRFHLGKMAPGPRALESPDKYVFTPREARRLQAEQEARTKAEIEARQRYLNSFLVKARKLWKDGHVAKAQIPCRELIEKEPETPQAAEARKLLKKMDASMLSAELDKLEGLIDD